MLNSDKLERNFTPLLNGPFSGETVEDGVRSKQPDSIRKRIEELKTFAEEDGDRPPVASSEEAMLHFLSLFNIRKMPEITLTDDGCYYLRIVNGPNKLVLRFLADKTIHYLLEDGAGYIEEINTIAFFKNKYHDLVRESIVNE